MWGILPRRSRLCRQAETVAHCTRQLCNTLCALFARASGSGAETPRRPAPPCGNARDPDHQKQDYFLLRRRSARRAFPASSGVGRNRVGARGRSELHVRLRPERFRLAQGRTLLLAGDAAAVLRPVPPCCNPLSSTSTACSSSTPISSWRRPCHARRAKGA